MVRHQGMGTYVPPCPPEPFTPGPPSNLLADHLYWLLEQTQDGVCVIDRAGICLFANPSAARTLDRAVPELLHHRFHDLVHPAVAGSAGICSPECPMRGFLWTGDTPHSWPDRFRRRDGTWVVVQCALRPLISGDRLQGAILLFGERATSGGGGGADDAERPLGASSEAQEAEARRPEERQRLAGELHDGLAQILTAAGAHLDACRLAEQKGDRERAARALERGTEFVKASVVEVRRLVRELRGRERRPRPEVP